MSCPKVGPCNPFIQCSDLCCLDLFDQSGLDPARPCSGHLPDPCNVNGKPVPPDLVHNSIQAASEIMWAATGRQFGTCTVKIRPCKQKCGPCGDEFDAFSVTNMGAGFGSFPWLPAMTSEGLWTNIPACDCSNQCCHVCEIELPDPVCCINEVRVDGITLSPNLYRVDDFRTLVRLPGNMTVQDLTVPSSAVNVVGPGAAFTPGLGFELPNHGPDQYDVQLLGNRRGVTFDLLWGPGVSGTIGLFGVGAGDYSYSVVSGHPTVSKTGVTLTVGPPQDSGSNAVVRITMNTPGSITDFFIQQNLSFANSLFLKQVGWVDDSPAAANTPAACWPDCQTLDLPDTEKGTFSVNLTFGRQPPQMVKFATAEFACQLIKNCVGAPCQLPQRIQNISRQGITIGMLDPMVFLEKGHTGIYLVDMVINNYNPARLPRRAGVSSIDFQPRWRITNTDSCNHPVGTCNCL